MNSPCSAAGKRKKKHREVSRFHRKWLKFKEKLTDSTFSLHADDLMSVEEDV